MTGFSNPLKRGVPSGVAALSAAGSVLSAVVGESANGNEGFGQGALTANTTGAYSTALGNNALAAQTTANAGGNDEEGNTAIGASAMASILTGQANVAVGGAALASGGVGTASDNVAIGNMALEVCQDGNWNVAIGPASQNYFQHSSGQVSIGFQALSGNPSQSPNTGSYNVAIGFLAMTTSTSGQDNVGVGTNVLQFHAAGFNNTALGAYAGTNGGGTAGNQTVAGVYNTWIGTFSGPGSAADPSYCTTLGSKASCIGSGSVAIGTDSSGNGAAALVANQIVLGTALHSVTVPGLFFPQSHATAGAPGYVMGAMYYDTTLHKLRIGGATGWETVTSV